MNSPRAPFVLLVLALTAFGCGAEEATESEPTPAAQATPSVEPASPSTPTEAELHGTNGVVFRWSDGDWIARITLSVNNRTSTAVAVTRAGVLAEGMTAWASSSTFPESANVAPGQSVRGDLAWYTSGAQPAPRAVRVSFGTWSATVPLVEVPMPPPPGTSVTAPVQGSLAIAASGNGQTWRHPSDNDHIVKVQITVTNQSNIPVEIPARMFGADIGSSRGSWWSTEATIGDPVALAPGASTTGFVSWYFSDELPVPTSVNVRLGAQQAPLSTVTVRLDSTAG